MSPTAPSQGRRWSVLPASWPTFLPSMAQRISGLIHCPGSAKALWAITHCRTAALGGQHEWCEACGFEQYTYHSCRNRHCPKCQSTDSAAWAAARQQELLPVPYFHDVFTLPHEFHGLILYSERNQGRSASAVRRHGGHAVDFRPRRAGRSGRLHPRPAHLGPASASPYHLHCLIASGALSADGSQWIAGGRKFLFPVRGLSKMFRASTWTAWRPCWRTGSWTSRHSCARLKNRSGRRPWLRRCKKPWVVYAKPPFAGPRKLVNYLARYTHRVAISNDRLLDCRDGQVRYTYRDRQDGDRRKVDTLPAAEFLQRFLQHVLPDGFCRIRHYGLLANCVKRQRLALVAACWESTCRRSLRNRRTTPPSGWRPCWGSTSRNARGAAPG